MSRKIYTIKVDALVTLHLSDFYHIEATDLETAKTKAKEEFAEMLEDEFGWYDANEINADYTEVAEYE